MVQPFGRVLLVGCNECMAAAHAGGEAEVTELASMLRIKAQKDGKSLGVFELTPKRVCEPEYIVDVLAEAEKVQRRTGAMLLVDGAGRLTGILTDADLRRVLLANRGGDVLEMPARQFMTRNPKHASVGDLASEALATLHKYRIDELPVLDAEGKPVGVIDVQDMVGIKTVSNDRD